jgi:hypothetical protein
MADYHLPPTATPAEVSAAVRENGFVIDPNLENELMDAFHQDLVNAEAPAVAEEVA